MRETSPENMTFFEMKGVVNVASDDVAFSISICALDTASAPNDRNTLALVAIDEMFM